MHLGKIKELAAVLWDYHHRHDIIESADVIMVLGSTDTRVADRGVDLYEDGKAPLLLFSGGLGRKTKDNKDFIGKSEAEVFAKVALDRGVPIENIILETNATNTGENIHFSYELIKDKNIQKIILVQKPYMERRTYATFARQWPGSDVSFCVTSPQITMEDFLNEYYTLDYVVSMMVGDLQRIIEYPKKGRQIPQHIPQSVIDAYKELMALGYTQNLITI